MKRIFKSLRFGRRAKIYFATGMILAITARSFGDSSTTTLAVTAKPNSSVPVTETGVASYYGAKYHGKPTASGEIFDMNELTAAHPTLTFGTRVKVTHLENNRSVIVRINDRGPFVQGRVIDLSQAAATELQLLQSGLARVKIEVIK